MGTRRENGAGSVYFDHKTGTACRDSRFHRNCTGRWSASLSGRRDGSGKTHRVRLTARTKTDLLAKIRDAQQAAENGIKVSTAYTVGECLDDFLTAGLEGLAPGTVTLYEHIAKLLRPLVGGYRLRELSSVQAQAALRTIADSHSTRTVSLTRNVLERAIRFAQAQDKVSRNVATVIKTPAGQKAGQGRQAFSPEEMFAVLDASVGWKNMDAFIHLGFMTGASPDELRGLHWDQVDDLDSPEPGIDITRTLRHGGGTKTKARVRGLGLPEPAVDALKRHRAVQAAERLKAGDRWEDNGLVFCTSLGRPLDRGNVGRAFKLICGRAGIGDADKRVPYEMRHTYASIVHDSGVPAEEVAQQLGHSRTAVFEMVYRHVLTPRRREGQRVMDTIARQRVV
jgi:integrase